MWGMAKTITNLATATASILLCIAVYLTTDKGEPSVCPDFDAIQSDFVKNYYNEEKHEGFFYEMAFKDVTQPRICKCNTSNKTIVTENKLQDDFNIQCSGNVYHSDLSFDLNVNNTRRGFMIGRWHGFKPLEGVEFPNTIVDVGVNENDGSYDWVIEFQCIQGKKTFFKSQDWIPFFAINFYSRNFDDQTVIAVMTDSALKHGLSPFLEGGLDLFVVDHTGCIQDH